MFEDLLTADEKQTIYEDILRRNELRRLANMPRLDVTEEVTKQWTIRARENYFRLASDFIKAESEKYDTEKGKPYGFVMRNKKHVVVMQRVYQRMRDERCIELPRDVSGSVVRFGSG